MKLRRTIALLALLAAVLSPARLAAQRVFSPWREFRAADGLKESFSTTITVGQRVAWAVRNL